MKESHPYGRIGASVDAGSTYARIGRLVNTGDPLTYRHIAGAEWRNGDPVEEKPINDQSTGNGIGRGNGADTEGEQPFMPPVRFGQYAGKDPDGVKIPPADPHGRHVNYVEPETPSIPPLVTQDNPHSRNL